MNRLHRAIERRTGLIFGTFTVTGHTGSGYPLERIWLMVCPRRDGYAFSVTVRSHGFYLDYVPRHELAQAEEVA